MFPIRPEPYLYDSTQWSFDHCRIIIIMSALDKSLGAIEVGVLVSTILFGFFIAQCYTYYQAGFKDKWIIQALVSSMSRPTSDRKSELTIPATRLSLSCGSRAFSAALFH